MTTARQHASAFAAAFTTSTRTDGSEVIHLRVGSPDWMTDAIREAHGDSLPIDSIYAACKSAAEALADSEEWGDSAHEWANSEVSVYNAARVAWLAELPIARGLLIDEACEEIGATEENGIFDRIALGWYEENRRIWQAISSACEAQADEESED